MSISRVLLRLLNVRQTEEEQRRVVLESALGELRALEAALAASHARRRNGASLLTESFGSSEILDRTAAQVEVEAARRRAEAIASRLLPAAEIAAAHARQQYLAKRLERRQAQTLIEKSLAQEELTSRRRTQQGLDEVFGARLYSQCRDDGHKY